MYANRLLLISAALMVAGCGTTDPITVAVSTSATPSPVKASETTTVTVSMTNLSARTVQVPSPEQCGYFFSIVDMNGRRAELKPEGCILLLRPPVDLSPGETVTYTRPWVPSTATIDGESLPPGDYTIRPVDFPGVSIGQGAFGQLVVEP